MKSGENPYMWWWFLKKRCSKSNKLQLLKLNFITDVFSEIFKIVNFWNGSFEQKIPLKDTMLSLKSAVDEIRKKTVQKTLEIAR